MKGMRFVSTVFLLCCCCSAPLIGDMWSAPNGQTYTTQAGSTPPVSGAQRVANPTTKQVQTKSGQTGLQVVIPSAPSGDQLQNLLGKDNQKSSSTQVTPQPIKTSQALWDARVGQTGGQCAVFAQKARPELTGFGNANQMPDTARKNGFEVDGTPHVGSVMVVEKPVGSTYGHAEVVTSAMKLGEKYVMTIVDSNANEDGLVSARTIHYTPAENGAYGNYGKYEEASPGTTKLAKGLVVMGFINGKTQPATK